MYRGENGNKKGHIFTSGFRGVYSRGDKWNAQIQYNGKKVVRIICKYKHSIWVVIHLKKKQLELMILQLSDIMVTKRF